MTEKSTFTAMGEKYMKSEITGDEFTSFFEIFKTGLLAVKDEFKNKIEPAIYFNPDNKKLAEKSVVFMSIYDDYEKGIAAIEKALHDENREHFQKGYTTILSSTEKLNALRKDVTDIMNTMTPI
jgi:hypothetical protein